MTLIDPEALAEALYHHWWDTYQKHGARLVGQTPAMDDFMPTFRLQADALAPLLADAEQRVWEQAHNTFCPQGKFCSAHQPGTYHLLALRQSGGVTSVEPGCTCGGMAACPQCQDRDAALRESGGAS